jgi:hypothetical protein
MALHHAVHRAVKAKTGRAVGVKKAKTQKFHKVKIRKR